MQFQPEIKILRDQAARSLARMLPDVPNIVIALASELPPSFRGVGIAYTGKDLDVIDLSAVEPRIEKIGRTVQDTTAARRAGRKAIEFDDRRIDGRLISSTIAGRECLILVFDRFAANRV